MGHGVEEDDSIFIIRGVNNKSPNQVAFRVKVKEITGVGDLPSILDHSF